MVLTTMADESAANTAPLIDARGKRITPAILWPVVQALRGMESGDTVEVLTDEFEAIDNDLAAWCRMAGHRLTRSAAEGESHRYAIIKGDPPETPSTLAMVISSDGLLELLSPLGFALGAALAGSEVHLYFQGPAVRVLKRGFKARLKGLGRPFTRFAANGLAQMGHAAPQDKLRQLQQLGGQLYICGGSMDHFKVRVDDLAFEDVIVAEYLTFMEVMNRSQVQLMPA